MAVEDRIDEVFRVICFRVDTWHRSSWDNHNPTHAFWIRTPPTKMSLRRSPRSFNVPKKIG